MPNRADRTPRPDHWRRASTAGAQMIVTVFAVPRGPTRGEPGSAPRRRTAPRTPLIERSAGCGRTRSSPPWRDAVKFSQAESSTQRGPTGTLFALLTALLKEVSGGLRIDEPEQG